MFVFTKDSYILKRNVSDMTRSAANMGKCDRLDRNFNMQLYDTGKFGQMMKITYLVTNTATRPLSFVTASCYVWNKIRIMNTECFIAPKLFV